jgi:hypothetical protein
MQRKRLHPRTKLLQSLYNENFEKSPTRNEQRIQRQLAKIWNHEFVPLSLAGRCSQVKNNVPIDFLLLADAFDSQIISNIYNSHLQSKNPSNECINALPLPLSPNDTSSLRLLSHAYASTTPSKTTILRLNSLFINRDGGLFDNLPWNTWSIDPDRKERDASNNVAEAKFSMGKRVGFWRFMGRDWKRGWMRGDSKDGVGDEEYKTVDEEEMMAYLSRRMLELEIDELRMEVAGCEQRLAVRRGEIMNSVVVNEEYSDFADALSDGLEVQMLNEAKERLQVAESCLDDLANAIDGESKAALFLPFSLSWEKGTKTQGNNRSIRSTVDSILSRFDKQVNEAPYRGAIGYPPKRDSADKLPQYASPYSLLLEIINEQLNAEIVACVLEQTSLLEGNLVLGGALLLQRKGRKKSTTIAREKVDYIDTEDDFGNEGVLPQSLYVVECFSDEAIGVALETELPLYLGKYIWGKAGGIPVEVDFDEATKVGVNGTIPAMSRLPILRPLKNGLVVSMEGERVSTENEANSVRIPLPTTAQFFDRTNQLTPSSTDSRNAPVFSTYTPVSSLQEYDSLTDDGKARILLKLGFKGVLPRPRAVRASNGPTALDNLLLPLIDESVRRQYLIREAEQRNDVDAANALRSEMSQRQSVLEQAQSARDRGLDEEAKRLDDEAELYKSLRADATQDEGAYSRYLDRDDWYERETQARIRRLKKSQGTE